MVTVKLTGICWLNSSQGLRIRVLRLQPNGWMMSRKVRDANVECKTGYKHRYTDGFIKAVRRPTRRDEPPVANADTIWDWMS